MTTIDKLLIQGIRSFSPQNRNIIEFYKPLTIIVGPNGAGKTTIIECLRYACTGETPPHSQKGQAFVHDTKIAGEREVKAQIKMRFRNVNGKAFVCTRSLQLTQKPSKQEFKSLEGAIQTYNAKGEKVSQSFRCVDLDREIPELMGVSKPILENVIFCHQEDSCWPLAESSILKKKFDEIFAATRYTKALEVIKKQRKEQSATIKESKLRLETLQANMEYAHNLENERKALQDKTAVLDKEISSLDEKISSIEAQLDVLRQKSQHLTKAIAELHEARTVHTILVRDNQKLEETVSELYTETDEELNAMQTNFSRQLEELRDSELRLTDKLSRMKHNRENYENLSRTLADDAIRLQALIDRQRNLAQQRDRRAAELAAQLHISDMDTSNAEAVLRRMQQMIDARQKELEECKATFQARQQQLNEALTSGTEEQTALRVRAETKTRQIAVNKHKIDTLTADIAGREAAATRLEQAEAECRAEESLVNELKREFNAAELNQRIGLLVSQKVEIEAVMTKLTDTRKQLLVQQTTRSRLEIKRADKAAKEEALNARLAAKEAQFRSLLRIPAESPLPSADKLKTQVVAVQTSRKEAALQASSALHDEKMKLSTLEGQRRSVEDQLNRLRTQLRTKTKKLHENLPEDIAEGGRTLVSLLEETEAAITELKRELAKTNAAELMYRNFIHTAKENAECPLCERALHGASALREFIERLERTLANVPASIAERNRELQEKELIRRGLEQLRPEWEDRERLKTVEIPDCERRLAELAKQRESIAETIAERTAILEQRRAEEAEASALVAEAMELARMHADLMRAVHAVEEDEERLRKSGSSDTRTIEEIDREYQVLQAQSAELGRQMDEIRRDMQTKQSELHRRGSDLHKRQMDLLEMKRRIDAITTLRQNIEELSTANEALEREIQEANTALEDKGRAIEELKHELNALRAQFERTYDQLQHERDAVRRAHVELEHLTGELRATSMGELANQLKQIEEQRTTLASTIAKANDDINKTGDEIMKIKEKLVNSNVIARTIADNLKLRKQKVHIETLSAKIGLLEKETGGVSPDADISSLEEEYRLLKTRRDQLVGHRKGIREEIARKTAELRKPQYEKIEEHYRQMLITLKTTEMANSDLEKYYTALDKALMRFHSLKMAEINKIIKELWQSTYKGNDIDTIELRSFDDETATKASGSRSYNYRLVMIKGDTELDMRGRCSAGQKVLASLIIRLALAETFCLNCGILALDEPTTNLDRYNVESFAQALVNIIESRRKQSNFQLIIITHDEEFVGLLGRSEHADYYWRVSKDVRGHSIIERQDIRDLN